MAEPGPQPGPAQQPGPAPQPGPDPLPDINQLFRGQPLPVMDSADQISDQDLYNISRRYEWQSQEEMNLWVDHWDSVRR